MYLQQNRVLVNVDHEAGEPDIFLLECLAQRIKAHQVYASVGRPRQLGWILTNRVQIGGVRMMYDVIVESLAQYGKDPGYGCGM